MDLGDPLATRAATDPDGSAIIVAGAVTTWSALNARVNRMADGLAGLGVGAGERVVWCGPNSVAVVAAMHACRKLGVVAVPLPYRLTPEESDHIVGDSGAVAAIVDPAHRTLVRRLGHVMTFDAPVLGSAHEPPAGAGAGAGAGKVMLYTSGTTGRPKGAVRPPTDPATRAAMMAALRFAVEREVHLVTGPLYHAGPHAFALLTHLTGGTLVLTPRFDPAEWVRLVAAHGVTSAFVAPIHLKRIVALPDSVLAAADLSSLRSVIVNAAPVPYALKQEVVAKLGGRFLYEVYGSTELGIATVLGPEEQLRKPGSCGRAYGGIGLKIVDDAGGEVPPGVVGEVFVRTPQAFEGYHGGGDLPGEDGWKSVGDLGWLDDESYLHICDRRTDLVITGGMNVYPAEVEAVLHAHPDVADAAVIGIPDDGWGQRVHAVVTARPGRELDPSALDAFVSARLAGFKRPRSWEVRTELPRTESGKVLRRLLREQLEECRS